jgi:hypothetical protein
MTRAPLRFLLTVLALWIAIRAAILSPDWPAGFALLPEAAAEAPPHRVAPAAAPTPAPPANMRARATIAREFRPESAALTATPPAARLAGIAPIRLALPEQSGTRPLQASLPGAVPPMPPALRAVQARDSRWSLSAWLLVRDESGTPALTPGGTLGGSQAGARLNYVLGGGVSLAARVYLPLRHPAGAEVAGGLDWQPLASLPLHLLAERRQRLGRDGRSALAVTLYGGASKRLGSRLRLDVYGQAGVVGRRARDLFADGALRLSRQVGPVELGAGAWGAAQRGARRLDAGPSLSWRLPVPNANLRLQADWRFRIAGDAMPRSGPALTLAADF